MTGTQMRFDDGAGYERYMGNWSRRVGTIFLDWLAAPSGLKWIDVGCGNGAFTELIVERCAPTEVRGIDPSEDQLTFARTRPAARLAKFDSGDAIALPFPTDTFDVAVMALVIFFVPDPGKGVAEMSRVVRPGGVVAAYAWDMFGGGFPLEPIRIEMRAMGISPLNPPSVDACRTEAMRDLWRNAGLDAVETREIAVQRTFDDFEDFWTTGMLGTSIRPTIAAMSSCTHAPSHRCSGTHYLRITRQRDKGSCLSVSYCAARVCYWEQSRHDFLHRKCRLTQMGHEQPLQRTEVSC